MRWLAVLQRGLSSGKKTGPKAPCSNEEECKSVCHLLPKNDGHLPHTHSWGDRLFQTQPLVDDKTQENHTFLNRYFGTPTPTLQELKNKRNGACTEGLHAQKQACSSAQPPGAKDANMFWTQCFNRDPSGWIPRFSPGLSGILKILFPAAVHDPLQKNHSEQNKGNQQWITVGVRCIGLM